MHWLMKRNQQQTLASFFYPAQRLGELLRNGRVAMTAEQESRVRALIHGS